MKPVIFTGRKFGLGVRRVFSDEEFPDIMAYEKIHITPVSPALGAEVRGVDLNQPLSNRQFSEIHRAFTEHQVLFFREQEELAPER